jgi:hypothetical protein
MALGSMGRGGASSNNALLVVHCDGPVASERVARSFERLLDVCPWPSARLRRRLPWGPLHWAAGRRPALRPPPVLRRAVATPEELHQAVDDELNAAIDPTREPPLRVLLLDGASATAGAPSGLVVTWFHPLMDPRGAQNLLHHLCHLDAHPGSAPWDAGVPVFTAPEDSRTFRERGRLARQSLAHMRSVSGMPATSPGERRAGPVRFRRETFVEGEPGPDRGTREIWWRLAVVGKAMRQTWARRNLPDAPFLLPIAVDLRPKGEPGPTFGNMLAFHFARFRPSDTADLPGLASALRGQMADAVRQGQIEANEAAMTFLKYRPLAMVRRAVRGFSGGEAFSFNCADVSDFPAALARCFGRRVLNAYHVPAVPPRPGIGVFFNRWAGRNNVVVAWIDGTLSGDDVTRIVEIVRTEMGWQAAP